jgi:hypothetical protein
MRSARTAAQSSGLRIAPIAVSTGHGNNRTAQVDYDMIFDIFYFEVGAEQTKTCVLAEWLSNRSSLSLTDLVIKRL